MLEPHTGKKIPLGTKDVREYEIPWHLYHTIIYVEKKGMLSRFEMGKIAERYDAAIICAEGYAVRAAKYLLHAAQDRKDPIRVFVVHDADPAGYDIARTLSRASGAHKFNIEVVDWGLNMDEAVSMGLETETFTRKKALPKDVEFSDFDHSYFDGEEKVYKEDGKWKTKWVKCHRIELNALSADPKAFIDWIVRKLKEHGADEKLIPSPEVVEKTARSKQVETLRSTIENNIMSELGIEYMVDRIADKLSDDIETDDVHDHLTEWGKDLPPKAWDAEVGSVIHDRVHGLMDEIADAVADEIKALGDSEQQ